MVHSRVVRLSVYQRIFFSALGVNDIASVSRKARKGRGGKVHSRRSSVCIWKFGLTPSVCLNLLFRLTVLLRSARIADLGIHSGIPQVHIEPHPCYRPSTIDHGLFRRPTLDCGPSTVDSLLLFRNNRNTSISFKHGIFYFSHVPQPLG